MPISLSVGLKLLFRGVMIQYLLRIVLFRQSTGKSTLYVLSRTDKQEYRLHKILDSRLDAELPPSLSGPGHVTTGSLPLYSVTYRPSTRRDTTSHTARGNDFSAYIPITYPDRTKGDFDRSSLLVVTGRHRFQG
jgi:hypothetical protein